MDAVFSLLSLSSQEHKELTAPRLKHMEGSLSPLSLLTRTQGAGVAINCGSSGYRSYMVTWYRARAGATPNELFF